MVKFLKIMKVIQLIEPTKTNVSFRAGNGGWTVALKW
jgi:hypothetical protein